MTVWRFASERSLDGSFRKLRSSFAWFLGLAMVLVVREENMDDVIEVMSQRLVR